MSLLIASVMATSIAGMGKNRQATKAQDEANELAKYQDLINIEQQAQSNYIEEYNARTGLASVESAQGAQMATLGKRDSAGVDSMQKTAQEDLQTNVDRQADNIQLSREMATLNDKARQDASASARRARNIGTVGKTASTGLLFAGKK